MCNLKNIYFVVLLSMLAVTTLQAKRYQCGYFIVSPDVKGTVYSDSLCTIQFALSENSMGFSLQNNSSNPILIDWEKCAIIKYGTSMRCIHAGIKYNEKANLQTKTIVFPSTQITDLLCPAENIWWYTPMFQSSIDRPRWCHIPLVILNTKREDGFKYKEEQILAQENLEIGVVLALEVNEKVEYKSFVIKCVNFQRI
ncbi:MAG: hypothetical protein Q4E32_04850 [Bacteroidales bacterium]|nr:hypothetical protein [Bacteroidales bacterium]